MKFLNFFRKKTTPKDWTSLKVLGLPTRLFNMLMNEDIYSICELQEAVRANKLVKIKGFGINKAKIVGDALAAYEEDPEFFKLKNL